MQTRQPQSHRDLEIWKMAHALAISVHKMTLEKLPKTGSLTDKNIFEDLHQRFDLLGKKINSFRQAVIKYCWQPKDQIGEQFSEDHTD